MVFQLDVTNAIEVLKPLATFIFTMSVYTVFIFKFYKFLTLEFKEGKCLYMMML